MYLYLSIYIHKLIVDRYNYVLRLIENKSSDMNINLGRKMIFEVIKSYILICGDWHERVKMGKRCVYK